MGSKLTDEEIINSVYLKFETKIERRGSEFILVSNDFTPDHGKVKEINKYIEYLRKANELK
jgi:hypothetical protein